MFDPHDIAEIGMRAAVTGQTAVAGVLFALAGAIHMGQERELARLVHDWCGEQIEKMDAEERESNIRRH